MKTVDFSETIAASDLKGSRSRHHIRRYVSIEGQGHFLTLPGAIARSVAMPLGKQEALRSILASGTSFREDLVMKLFLRPFFLFR